MINRIILVGHVLLVHVHRSATSFGQIIDRDPESCPLECECLPVGYRIQFKHHENQSLTLNRSQDLVSSLKLDSNGCDAPPTPRCATKRNKKKKEERKRKEKNSKRVRPAFTISQSSVRDQNEFSTTFLTCTLMNNHFLSRLIRSM